MRVARPLLRPLLVGVCVPLVLLAAGGCGQRGPLYLRDAPPPGVKTPKPEPYQPVPYPQQPGEDETGAKKK
jgi:predicted small lipoprotein YifL